MTAVIYARYSTDSQREESIEGQIRECTAYAEKNGFTVVKHYIDRAISAKTDNRPQFQQMIKDSERGIFDVIIVWKLDRFARNRYDSARYKTQLKRNGVKLVSATEVISAGPEGIILESVLEGYAEYYSADLSEKVVRGMTENALKGIYNGGTIPFGYMIDETRHYQPDPLLAPYVEQTFQKYADGATMTDLRDWLKAHNIKNSMGGEMSYNTIQRMLSNRRYIGELRLRDVVQPNAIPALVSEELFNKVQEKLAKNKKAPARHKAEESYLLTTKLYCGKCGALMFGESGVSHTGKMYTYYKCAAAKKKKTCDKKAVRKQWLEDLVVNETMKLVEDDASMNAIIAKVMELQNQESTDLPIYEKQLKETEVGITNMLNAIQMGILTSSTKERLEALEEQRKELQARIAEERLAKPKMKEEFVRFWLLRFRKLDMTQPEQRQALVDTFINAIYLYDDKVLITFNYKEGTETVAFGEAVKAEKSSDMSARGAPNFERQIVRFGVLSLCRKAAAHVLHTVCTLDFLQGRKADTAKLTKNKAKHCDTLQNTKLPDEKVAALFRLKETAKNAILSLTEAKALSEKIAKRLFVPCGAAFVLRLGQHLRVAGLIDMGLGQAAHGVLVVAAGVGGVQDIHHVQLGKAGGHGAVAEQALVGGHIQHMVGQLRHLGGVVTSHRDHRCAARLHFFDALDHLHGLPGVGEHDAHILRGGVARLQKLRVGVLVDHAGFVQPQKFQVGVLCHAQRRADAEQQHRAGVGDQLYALLQLVQQQQPLGVQQALDVLVSHLLHDLLQAVLWGDVLFPVAAVLAKGGKLQRQGVAQLLVALKANHPADAHHAGRGGKGAPRQLPNGKGGGLVRVVQNELRNLPLGAAEGGLHLPQA